MLLVTNREFARDAAIHIGEGPFPIVITDFDFYHRCCGVIAVEERQEERRGGSYEGVNERSDPIVKSRRRRQ